MKNFIYKGIAVALILFNATACNDFLEEEVPGKLNEEDFYQTDADVLMAVNAVYDLNSAEYNKTWASPYLLKTLLSDEGNAGGSNNGDQVGYQNLDDFNIDSQNDKVRDVWKLYYYTIYRANIIFEKSAGNSDIYKRLIAEAKTLRALNYFNLVTLWGDVPLVLKGVDPSEFTTTSRESKETVYGQIETDLLEAIPDLPVKSGYSDADKFRVSKGMAQSLLGKVYLFQKLYQKAQEQFDAVIASGEYSLENELQTVFSEEGEFGKESIFEIPFTGQESYNGDNFPWGGIPESNIHIQLMGPRSDYYTPAKGDSLIGGWGFNLPKKKMYDAFVAAGDVNRRRITIISEEELVDGGGKWTLENAWDYEGYFQRKYGSFSTRTDTTSKEYNYSNDFIIIRYADVLLMAAEAHYRNSDEATALDYINQVRTRPGTDLPEINVSGNDVFDAIVTERQLELAFEGHRFLDLVRWDLADQELGPLGFKKGQHEVLPIPLVDVRSGGLPQNDGYGQ